MARTNQIRASDEEYKTLNEAQKKLIKHGLNALPEELREYVTDFALGEIVMVSAKLLIKQLEKGGS